MKHAKLWLTLMILSVKSEVADAVRENQWLWLTLVVPVWTPLAMLLLGRVLQGILPTQGLNPGLLL